MASLRRLLEVWVMALLTLVVAHQLVFLLAYGSDYDAALARSGHDGSWASTVAAVLLAAGCLFALATWRLYRLGVIVRSLAPNEGTLEPSARDFARSLLDLWWRLWATAAALFVLEENLEHLRIGESLPGPSVLTSAAYPNAVWIIAGTALLVAIVGAIFGWRRARLLALIATVVRRRPRPGRAARRPIVDRDRRPASLVGRGFAVRAPPLPAR